MRRAVEVKIVESAVLVRVYQPWFSMSGPPPVFDPPPLSGSSPLPLTMLLLGESLSRLSSQNQAPMPAANSIIAMVLMIR